MRTNYRFKTALLLLMAVGGASSAWAEGTISFPQNLGSYIVIGTTSGGTATSEGITIANCKVDDQLADNGKYYSIGTTGSSTTMDITFTPEAGSYVFGFKSGAEGCSSTLTVTLTKSGSATPVLTQDVTIANTGSWTPSVAHNFYFKNLEAATYTVHIAVKEITSGSYAGNFGNFFFHKVEQLAWPTSSNYMELSDGTFSNARDNNNVVNYIDRKGGSIDDLLIYNATAGYYFFHFKIDAYKQASKVTITVTDFATGIQEAQTTTTVTAAGNYLACLTSEISTGLKKVRFDFADNDETSDDSYLFNFSQVCFTTSSDFDALPLKGTATLNLNQTGITKGDCNYEEGNSNIGFVKNGSYVDGYYVYNANETAYYSLCAGIPWYNAGGTFKLTVTDVATGTEEVSAQESPAITGTGDVMFTITNSITRGLKRIRIDFYKDGESGYLFNLNNVSFYKRSLNEAYDYTPVEASGVDVVLTRSLTAGKWSTIVLPFAMTSGQITSAFGSDAKVAALTSATADALTFSTVTAMEANQPYAIKVATDFTSATISNVNIDAATPTQTVGNWNFVGTYENGTIPDGSYYFSSNKLWQADGTGIRMKPFRAYFTNGTAAPTLNFIIDSETTGIGEKLNVNSNNAVSATYYNLNGQRVSQPTKGLYIVNGKKVIIK